MSVYKKMHDGPSDNYHKSIPVNERASLSALQWAADRANQSYGVFTQRLTREDERRIQAEYEAYRAELAQNREKHADTSNIPEGYILTDNDI